MNYLMLVCASTDPLPAHVAAQMGGDVEAWIEAAGPRRRFGQRLADPATARSVRTHGGETVISDGPFIDAKEFIAGFDVLECADLDEALALAAAHPVARFREIEVRPIEGAEGFDDLGPDTGGLECLLFCIDGIPEPDEVEAGLRRDLEAWHRARQTSGELVAAARLHGPEAATTVRVRDGRTVLSDGPFLETKEYLAGIAVLRCAGPDAAIAAAAGHPLSVFHPIEVRSFWQD